MLTRRTTLVSLAAMSGLSLFALRASAQTGAAGTFAGASGHVTTGTAEIVTDGGTAKVRLGADFNFDGAPDPKVALGKDGYDSNALLAPLAKNTGAQEYRIPAGIDASAYNEVWIWCEQFNVPLGVARLGS